MYIATESQLGQGAHFTDCSGLVEAVRNPKWRILVESLINEQSSTYSNHLKITLKYKIYSPISKIGSHIIIIEMDPYNPHNTQHVDWDSGDDGFKKSKKKKKKYEKEGEEQYK